MPSPKYCQQSFLILKLLCIQPLVIQQDYYLDVPISLWLKWLQLKISQFQLLHVSDILPYQNLKALVFLMTLVADSSRNVNAFQFVQHFLVVKTGVTTSKIFKYLKQEDT